MDDFDWQNTDVHDDEQVQITPLGGPDAKPPGRSEKITGILYKGFKIAWLRYSLIGLLLFILVGALFLQIRQSGSPTVPSPVQHLANSQGNPISFGGDQTYIQTADGTLAAYRDENGQRLWRDSLPEQGSLLAFGPLIFCYYALTASTGTLVALDGKDGHVVWHAALPAPGTQSALEQNGDALYAADTSNTIHAFQVNNGQPRWTYPNAFTGQTLTIESILQIQAGVAEIFTSSNVLLALLRASNGQVLLLPPALLNNFVQITVDDQLIYELPSTPRFPIQVFRTSDGALLWSQTSPLLASTDALVELNGIIYLESSGDGSSAAITALRGSDGHILWTYHPRTSSTLLRLFPETDGTLDLQMQDNTIIHLQTSNAQVLWSTHLNETRQIASSTVEHGVLLLTYIGIASANSSVSEDHIYGLSLSTGTLLWSLIGLARLPATQTDMLYLANASNQVDAWRISDGTHLWVYQAPTNITLYADPPGLVLLMTIQGDIAFLRARDGNLLWRYQG